jgi:hypothetical protein
MSLIRQEMISKVSNTKTQESMVLFLKINTESEFEEMESTE